MKDAEGSPDCGDCPAYKDAVNKLCTAGPVGQRLRFGADTTACQHGIALMVEAVKDKAKVEAKKKAEAEVKEENK